MKKTLEKLWNEYLFEECSVIDTEEEKALLKKAAELHHKANELLTSEQIAAVEKHIEALYKMQDFFAKKAFFKGCQLAVSFIFEAVNPTNT